MQNEGKHFYPQFLLVCIILAGTQAQNDSYYRLPRSVFPIRYTLRLIPFLEEGNFTFRGEERIEVTVAENTGNITLNAYDITVLEETVTVTDSITGDTVAISSQLYDNDRQFYIIFLQEDIEQGREYEIYLKYIGNLNDQLHGFYRSSYQYQNETRWLATTQFSPTDARRAYPCFDEPAMKATFKTSLGRPGTMISLSNMPLETTESMTEIDGWFWDHYKETPVMSTYLTAFIVCDFQHKQNGMYSAWSKPSTINQVEYGLNISSNILSFYEEYFNVSFPLPKIDIAAIPDFYFGAMENWGLITFRESSFYYDPSYASSTTKQNVAQGLAHELGHQWFGNLVSPEWWGYLWLKEGFARYLEYVGTNAVELEWEMRYQFVVKELQKVFQDDSLKSTHPIAADVGNPADILQIFDNISYNKGSCIVRMMNHILTENVFRKGLTNYLRNKAYGSATQDDLWEFLTEEAHQDQVLDANVTVKEIMDTWTLQAGYPVVHVTRNYSDGSAQVSQTRFLLQNSSDDSSDCLWWIPLSHTTSTELDFNDTSPRHWLKNEVSTNIEDLALADDWIIFNIEETGFYRVNYDEGNWRLLVDYLHGDDFTRIGKVNRAQLLDDSWNLARAGILNYTLALEMSLYLTKELDYFPWASAFEAFDYVYQMFRRSPDYNLFKTYVLNITSNLYEALKNNSQKTILDQYMEINVLKWSCRLEREECVTKSVEDFQNWMKSGSNPIAPDYREVSYCTAIRYGGEQEWNFALEQFLNTDRASEKVTLLLALGCSNNKTILNRYLDMSISKNSGIRKQDATKVFTAVSNNLVGTDLAFNFLIANFSALQEYYNEAKYIGDILRGLATRFTTEEQLNKLKEFASEHEGEFGSASRYVDEALETTAQNIQWFESKYNTIVQWITSHGFQ